MRVHSWMEFALTSSKTLCSPLNLRFSYFICPQWIFIDFIWEKYHWINLSSQKYLPVYFCFRSFWSICRSNVVHIELYVYVIFIDLFTGHLCVCWHNDFLAHFQVQVCAQPNNWIFLENRLVLQKSAEHHPNVIENATSEMFCQQKLQITYNQYSNGWICMRPLVSFINMKRKKLA